MSLLVVGSIAYDSIHTPTGSRENCLGGSATYFALAARFFSPVKLVSVVGKDFEQQHFELLKSHGIDLEGVKISEEKTFRWTGKYMADMNQRETLVCELGSFGTFKPVLPDAWTSTEFIFLANAHPNVQAAVLDQARQASFVMADTMDLWIDTTREELLALLRRIDGLILNDEEAKLLTGNHNLIRAGKDLLELGPKIVIVKKGEHGCFLFSQYFQFALPSYPTENVIDPTGAGDSFAGGFMGFLASSSRVNLQNLKKAMAYGTVTASLNVESFGVDRLSEAQRSNVDTRYHELMHFVTF